MTTTVKTTHINRVAEIRFSRPPHNYASPDLLSQIADAVDAFDADPEIRSMVLTADGKSFCAGADLAGDTSMTGDDGMDSISQLYVQAGRLLRRKKPMIAAVQGAAIGAGLGLVLVADFRVATAAARFSANFTRLGFHPGFGLTCSLPRLIGPQKAAWMMLSSERVKADTALAWGLVDRLVADDDLLAEAHRMAGEIADNAPLALVAVRSTLMNGFAEEMAATMRHEHVQQSILKATADYREGVASVFERRDANFTGR
jgi:enoyl-CoA hydratase/carnithine racemase